MSLFRILIASFFFIVGWVFLKVMTPSSSLSIEIEVRMNISHEHMVLGIQLNLPLNVLIPYFL